MERLLEQVDAIKQKITSQEYLDMMEALGEARKVKKVSLYNVKLLVCHPEKGKYHKVSIFGRFENRLVMMSSDHINDIEPGTPVALSQNNSLSLHNVWVEKAIEMEIDDEDELFEVDYIKYRFLGAEKVEAELEDVDLETITDD